MSGDNRPRLSVDLAADWRAYGPIPEGCKPLGVVSRGPEVGALAINSAGVYLMCNEGQFKTLDQRKTAAAMRAAGALPDARGGKREGAGRPYIGEPVHIRLSAEDQATALDAGAGDLTAGIREALAQLRERNSKK